MAKITDPTYGDLSSWIATFQLIGIDLTESDITLQTKRLSLETLQRILITVLPSPGMMLNGKLVVDETFGVLSLLLLTASGDEPTPENPVAININGTIRLATENTSFNCLDGTNWWNAGSTELALELVPFFAYACWDSSEEKVILGASRKSYGRLASDFSSTETDETFLRNVDVLTTADTPDDVANIGYFEAALSSSPDFEWTIPVTNNKNLRTEPTFESQLMYWSPQHSRDGTEYTNLPETTNAYYQVINNRLKIFERHQVNGTPGGSGKQTLTLPWTNPFNRSQGVLARNASSFECMTASLTADSNVLTLHLYDGSEEVTASNIYILEGEIFIP